MKKIELFRFLLSFLFLFVLFYGLGMITTNLDWTWARILIGLVTVSAVTIAWSVNASMSIRQSFWKVGFGVPNWRLVAIAMGISTLMLAFFPLYASLTNVRLPLQHNWPWILVGILTGIGIAEETLFRGYVFGFLRENWTFWKAATLSMLLFGGMHLLLLLWLPVPLAVAAIILAIVAAYPSAYLFEKANRTIWPSAILHSTALATNLFEIPAELTVSFSLLWIGVVVIGLLLVFAAGRLVLGHQGINLKGTIQHV